MYNTRLGTIVFTVVETIAIVLWLVLVLDSYMPTRILGVAILLAGLTIEHLISYNVIHERRLFDFKGVPVRRKAVVSIIETVIWVIWLLLATSTMFYGFEDIVAVVVLAALLVFEHSISDNVFKDMRIFTRLLNRSTIGFSIIEAVGAAILLVLLQAGFGAVGAVVFLIFSFIEHSMAVRLARIK